MAVYVDAAIWKWAGHRWCHLMADDTDELHRFAAQLGVKRSSYQGPPRTSARQPPLAEPDVVAVLSSR